MVNRDLSNIREDYDEEGMEVKQISDNPVKQFDSWFREFLDPEKPDTNAMVLSTCGNEMRPSSRVVLLKSFDDTGFIFFTNYDSEKGKELEQNPFASLLFFWPNLQKQVRIEGKVEKVPEAVSDEYFHSRPRESQIAAYTSAQSSVIPDREDLVSRYRENESKFEDQEIPLPPNWGGYKLVPDKFEFWQGRENRLHDRIRYTLENNEWFIDRLSP